MLGYDVSGVVEAVGDGVTTWQRGDEVFYTPDIDPHGSYAPWHVSRADILARKPERLSHREAAALPLAGCTALQALLDRAQLRVGDTCVIYGTGGVGVLAVQIARAAGARVVAVGSGRMRDIASQRGAELYLDYANDDVLAGIERFTAGRGAEVVFDTVGHDTLARSVEVAAPHARMVSIVETTAGALGAGLAANLRIDSAVDGAARQHDAAAARPGRGRADRAGHRPGRPTGRRARGPRRGRGWRPVRQDCRRYRVRRSPGAGAHASVLSVGRLGRCRRPIQASAPMCLATSSTLGLRTPVHHLPTKVTMPTSACA